MLPNITASHAITSTSKLLDWAFSKRFKETTTAVLRKPRKPDYTKPNAYQSIILENTLGKVLESIIMELINYLTETHELLPAHHFGGRPGQTTEDMMLILSESIYTAWKKEEYTQQSSWM